MPHKLGKKKQYFLIIKPPSEEHIIKEIKKCIIYLWDKVYIFKHNQQGLKYVNLIKTKRRTIKTMTKKILNKPYSISTTIEIEDAEFIQDLAYERHISISQLVRDIILEYIEEHEQYF